MENGSSDDMPISDEIHTPPEMMAVLRRRTYNREYYHEHKAVVKCEHCENEYSCKSGLVKHQKRSQKCMVNKLQKYIADMDGKSHFGNPEKEYFTNILTRLETA